MNTEQVVVVGAGPAGTTTALMLARQGRRVVLVDRDPGPADDGSWERRGVMQFAQPHAFRTPFHDVLADRLPDVLERVMAEGAEPMTLGPEGPTLGLRCRRPVVDRVLREAAHDEPGVRGMTGHADRLLVAGRRVHGVVVDGAEVPADLVVVATGRSGRLGDGVLPARESSPCGLSYASRLHQLLPGREPPLINSPPGYAVLQDGYLLIVFLHDAGTFTVLLVRADDDAELAALRETPVWDRAMRLLPGAAAWTDPDVSHPISRVRPGAGLTNSYRHQATDLDGLLLVGDAVLTTNPAGGRGASHALASAAALVDVVTCTPRATWARTLDDWGERHLRPWVVDAVRSDAALLRRWAGLPPDLSGRLPADMVLAPLDSDPELAPLAGAYNRLAVGPDVFAAYEDRARQAWRSGWRPAPAEGPTRDQLVAALGSGAQPVASAGSGRSTVRSSA